MTTLRTHTAQSPRSHSRAGDRTWWAVLLTMCAILIAPLLVVDVPPLLDYPNHLARAFVLASLPADPILARFFTPHWSIIPNLAVDLLAPPLIHILPVHVVGRLLIAAAVLLPVPGAVAYNRALGGRWWSLAAALVAYNSCLLNGFLNFAIALGLALLLAAAWLHWRERHPTRMIALAIIGAIALFACHLMGLIFFALLIGTIELSRLHGLPARDLPRATISRGTKLLLIFAAPAALYALSGLQQLGGDAEFPTTIAKLTHAITAFTNYNATLDTVTALVVIGTLAASLLTRAGRFPAPSAYAVSILGVAYIAAPGAWKGTYLLDEQFAIMLALMLFAGFVPTDRPSPINQAAAVALTLLFVIRMTLLTIVWADHRTDLADLRRALQPVQPGQAVYVAEVGINERPAYWRANPHWRLLSDGTRLDEHLGALALIEHRAYWPFEFDVPSQQPIETREPYRTRATRIGQMPTFQQAAIADVCGFDYVLLMEADAVPDLPATRFRLLVRSGFAALYTITDCKEQP